jgi:NCS1 family nucleobase:cation symporter-1
MTAIAFVGVVVTSASTIVFGETIWDPVILTARFDSPILVSAAMIAIAISTLATNIAANIVSPANDFAQLAPRLIDFKRGGYLTGILGALIFPWKLVSDPTGYIFTWLIAYSSLLGPIGGILIVDYYVLRKKHLVATELYTKEGRYWYRNGFNTVALIALVAGILPNVPGFLTTVHWIPEDSIPALIRQLYHYAWFVGFGVSGSVYYGLTRR